MNRSDRRARRPFRPETEVQEDRVLLSGVSARAILALPQGFFHPARPNTPVLPFATASNPTFIDPTVKIAAPNNIAVGSKTLIAPFAVLDARFGFIKIGSGSTVQDSARIVGNPLHATGAVGVQIGDQAVISAGATVEGLSLVSAFGSSAKPTYVGPNAVIDGATIEPGAYVSALAKVGPGILIPAGVKVLPGADVTTQDEATNPALGKVTTVTAADTKDVSQILSNATAIANGYTSLYQGASATGTLTPTTTPTGVFNGNLAAVEGISQEAGSVTVSLEPKGAQSPQFPDKRGHETQVTFPQYRARLIGQAIFIQGAGVVEARLGHSVSIRADAGQPFKFGLIGDIGNNVTITSPNTGAVTLGNNVTIADNVVIGGNSTAATVIKNNVSIASGAVISGSTLGAGASIGANAYISNSTVAAGATIAPGTLLVNNKVVGFVQS